MTAKSIDFGQRWIEIRSSMEKVDKQPEIGQTPESLEEDSLPQPFQGDDMSVKVFYDHFCIWKTKMGAVNCDDEWYVVDFLYGLKMNLMVRVLKHRGIHRVSDAFSWARIEEILISWEENSGHNDADEVFEHMPDPESAHRGELQETEDVGNAEGDDLVVQIEVEYVETISSNTDVKVLDELPKPALTENAAYMSIDEESGVHYGLNSQAEPLKLMDKSTNPVFAGSKSFTGKFYSISTVKMVGFPSLNAGVQLTEATKELFSSKLEVMEDASLSFDVMPKPTSTMIGEELNVDYDSQAGINNQDIGDSEAHSLDLEALSWLFEENEQSSPFNLKGYPWGPFLHGCEDWQPHFSVVKGVNADHQLIDKVAERFPVKQSNESGIHQNFVLPVSFLRNCGLKDNTTHSVTDIHSTQFKLYAMVVFMFDPGIHSWVLKDYAFYNSSKLHNHSDVKSWFGNVLFLFDPGGNTFGNTSGYQNVLLQEVAQHVGPIVVGLNGDRLLGSMLAFGAEMMWQCAVVQFWELREIKRAPIVISIAYFSEKDWVTISGPNVKGSSAEKEIEDYRLIIMYIVLDLLRPGKLVLVLLLSELKNSKMYLSSNGYDVAIAVKLRNLVWDPNKGIVFLYTLDCFTFNVSMSWSRNKRKKGELMMKEELKMGIALALTSKQDENLNGVSTHDNVHKESLACTSVNAFRSIGLDCGDKFNASSLVLMTMQTWVFSLFVWDLGLGLSLAYILVDMDGFERVGRVISLLDYILVIYGYHIGVGELHKIQIGRLNGSMVQDDAALGMWIQMRNEHLFESDLQPVVLGSIISLLISREVQMLVLQCASLNLGPSLS